MKKTCTTCGVEKIANKTKSSQFSAKGKRFRSRCKTCENARKKHDRSAAKKLGVQRELDAIALDPYGHMAADIIDLAIREYRNWKDGEGKMAVDYKTANALARKSGFVNPVQEIVAFFASEWFVELCDATNTHPDTALNNIEGLRMAVTRLRSHKEEV